MTEQKPTYTVPYTKIRECGEPVEPLTPLQSELEKLANTDSKMTHLSPRECAAVLEYIRDLETDSAELSNWRADYDLEEEE